MLSRLFFFILFGLSVVVATAAEIAPTYLMASNAALDNPHDLKLSADGRYLFVSDVGNNRIAILDPDTLELVGSFGSDHQSGTHDIDFDTQGRAYVADTHNNRVTIYDINGTTAKLVGEINQRIRGPEGVLVHSNGQIYVAGAWSGNVVAYKNGRVVGELSGLSSPHDLEMTHDGDIWLSDAGNHRLLLLSPQLKIKRELGTQKYDFNGVRYMDLLSDGTLVVADKNNHVIKFIAADGTLLFVLGTGKPGSGVNQFVTPEGVEAKHNSLWFSDSGNNRIVKYRLD